MARTPPEERPKIEKTAGRLGASVERVVDDEDVEPLGKGLDRLGPKVA
jgi:hypothetical protein